MIQASQESLGVPESLSEKSERLERELAVARQRLQGAEQTIRKQMDEKVATMRQLARYEACQDAIDMIADYAWCFVYGCSWGDRGCDRCFAQYKGEQVDERLMKVFKVLDYSDYQLARLKAPDSSSTG